MYGQRKNFIELAPGETQIAGFICVHEGITVLPDPQQAPFPPEGSVSQPGAGAPFTDWVQYFNQNTGFFLQQLNGIQFELDKEYTTFIKDHPHLTIEDLNAQFNDEHEEKIEEFKTKFKNLVSLLSDSQRSPHKKLFWPLWTLPDSPVGYLFLQTAPHDAKREFEITARFFPDHAWDMVRNFSLIILSPHEPGKKY